VGGERRVCKPWDLSRENDMGDQDGSYLSKEIQITIRYKRGVSDRIHTSHRVETRKAALVPKERRNSKGQRREKVQINLVTDK